MPQTLRRRYKVTRDSVVFGRYEVEAEELLIYHPDIDRVHRCVIENGVPVCHQSLWSRDPYFLANILPQFGEAGAQLLRA